MGGQGAGIGRDGTRANLGRRLQHLAGRAGGQGLGLPAESDTSTNALAGDRPSDRERHRRGAADRQLPQPRQPGLTGVGADVGVHRGCFSVNRVDTVVHPLRAFGVASEVPEYATGSRQPPAHPLDGRPDLHVCVRRTRQGAQQFGLFVFETPSVHTRNPGEPGCVSDAVDAFYFGEPRCVTNVVFIVR